MKEKAAQYWVFIIYNIQSTDDDYYYDLISVMVHRGATTRSGHWYTFIKQPLTDIWLRMDDQLKTHVQMTIQEVINSNPQPMTFVYKRRQIGKHQFFFTV